MAPSPRLKRKTPSIKPIQTSLNGIESDPNHHLAGPFRPQTPLGVGSTPSSPAPIPRRGRVEKWSTESRGFWADLRSLRWVVVPSSSLKILLAVVALWANWEILTPYVSPGLPNPFAPLLFISHRIPTSSPDDPRYQKGYLDLAFVAYFIVLWSFVRQSITLYICWPLARWFGIRKRAKLDRFGEQGYAMVYFGFMAAWGIRIQSQLPTWWYNTKYFWIDYPHWEMKPELKAYYLAQSAYWCQQLIVLVFNLEKPRKDYWELVAHHLVTLWMVGWSYLCNLTLIGSTVYLSMDLPDSWFAASKLLVYIQYEKTKLVVFSIFICLWSYFRHFLNWRILWSVLFEFDLVPEYARRWSPENGVWLVWWMKWQTFVPLLILQFLNLFWYVLIWRVAYRGVVGQQVTDIRSDDEDEGSPGKGEDKRA